MGKKPHMWTLSSIILSIRCCLGGLNKDSVTLGPQFPVVDLCAMRAGSQFQLKFQPAHGGELQQAAVRVQQSCQGNQSGALGPLFHPMSQFTPLCWLKLSGIIFTSGFPLHIPAVFEAEFQSVSQLIISNSKKKFPFLPLPRYFSVCLFQLLHLSFIVSLFLPLYFLLSVFSILTSCLFSPLTNSHYIFIHNFNIFSLQGPLYLHVMKVLSLVQANCSFGCAKCKISISEGTARPLTAVSK